MSLIFKYKVITKDGQRLEGILNRDNIQSAAFMLRERGYYITELKQKDEKVSVLEQIARSLGLVKANDLAIFCRQMATMIESGIPLIRCLNVLADQTENKELKKGIARIHDGVASGESLASAMAGSPKIFPDLMVSMVKAGELGGILNDVLTRLATQYEKENTLQEKIKTAMTYPIVIALVAIVIVVFLLARVVPIFVQVFSNLELVLPMPTKLLISFSGLFVKYWYLAFLTIVFLFWIIKKYLNTEGGAYARDKLFLFSPIIGSIVKKVAIARFSRTLSTLLKGGIPILQALSAVEKTVGNRIIASSIASARNSIVQGSGLAKPLEDSGVFPAMVIEMVSVGEEAGALDEMLDRIADFYEEEASFVLSRISSIIEPLMIIVMSLIVGGVVAAIFLPMFDLIGLGF